MFKVLGMQNLKSKKDGKPYMLVHVGEQIAPQYGAGLAVEKLFVGSNVQCEPFNVGDDVNVIYGKGFDGKAYVVGIQKAVDSAKK